MLALKLRKILKTRGIDLPDAPGRAMIVVEDNAGLRIAHWDESILGPRPTDAEIAAVDTVALQAEIEAEEAAKRTRAEKLHALAEWLRTQTKEVREMFQEMQSELDTAKSAFTTLKTRYDKLENWAKTTKGYVP